MRYWATFSLPPAPGAEGAASGLVMSHGVQRLSALEKAALSWEIVLTYARARLLARLGIESTLVIGVHRGGDFEAHAWVEHDHRPVLTTIGRCWIYRARLPKIASV